MYPEYLEDDFLDSIERLGIDDELADDVLDHINYAQMDLIVDPRLEGDERIDQFVILAFNNCIREFGWDFDQMQLTFTPDPFYYPADYTG